MPNMHAQNTFGAKSMGFKILKPEGGGAAPVEHDFQLSAHGIIIYYYRWRRLGVLELVSKSGVFMLRYTPHN